MDAEDRQAAVQIVVIFCVAAMAIAYLEQSGSAELNKQCIDSYNDMIRKCSENSAKCRACLENRSVDDILYNMTEVARK